MFTLRRAGEHLLVSSLFFRTLVRQGDDTPTKKRKTPQKEDKHNKKKQKKKRKRKRKEESGKRPQRPTHPRKEHLTTPTPSQHTHKPFLIITLRFHPQRQQSLFLPSFLSLFVPAINAANRCKVVALGFPTPFLPTFHPPFVLSLSDSSLFSFLISSPIPNTYPHPHIRIHTSTPTHIHQPCRGDLEGGMIGATRHLATKKARC